jgi:hypothetical protein
MTFGISSESLFRNAASDDGRMEIQRRHIARRREIERKEAESLEQEESKSGTILYPQPNDVLVGRGRPYQEFPGNQRFGRLIDENLDRYHTSSDKFAKTCMSMDIVKSTQEYGGRFIERTPSGWKVIDDVGAREKTAIGFRSRVSKVSFKLGEKSSRAGSGSLPSSESKRARYDLGITQY